MNGLESIHWNQWNGNGFLVWQPLVPIEWKWFFNGLQPLVKRWDGNDPSLWSICTAPGHAVTNCTVAINVNTPAHACPKLNCLKVFELAREGVEFQFKQGHTESVTGTFLRAQYVATLPYV